MRPSEHELSCKTKTYKFNQDEVQIFQGASPHQKFTHLLHLTVRCGICPEPDPEKFYFYNELLAELVEIKGEKLQEVLNYLALRSFKEGTW